MKETSNKNVHRERESVREKTSIGSTSARAALFSFNAQ